jgi:hypothetical protein
LVSNTNQRYVYYYKLAYRSKVRNPLHNVPCLESEARCQLSERQKARQQGRSTLRKRHDGAIEVAKLNVRVGKAMTGEQSRTPMKPRWMQRTDENEIGYIVSCLERTMGGSILAMTRHALEASIRKQSERNEAS